MSYEGNHRFVSNKDQARCREGHFATVLTETDIIRRVECTVCEAKHTLYGEEL